MFWYTTLNTLSLSSITLSIIHNHYLLPSIIQYNCLLPSIIQYHYQYFHFITCT
ncbi:hypothetical protein Hanom_Chr06g00563671 [Helianthus anomalus]